MVHYEIVPSTFCLSSAASSPKSINSWPWLTRCKIKSPPPRTNKHPPQSPAGGGITYVIERQSSMFRNINESKLFV